MLKKFLIEKSHSDGRLETETRNASSADELAEQLKAENPGFDELYASISTYSYPKMYVVGKKYRKDMSGTETIINANEIDP